MKHELKIWPQYFKAVVDGSKTFEVRVNDRGFQKGDEVKLLEWDPTENLSDSPYSNHMETVGYTGESIEFTIGYVLPIDETRVVFSLLAEPPKESK